ncbi:MAG TPA: hypothetical protein VFT45_28265 [Longimicrobium sp.]|nr:hypothetical protein [Longimicrobium sp.]
MKFVRASTMAMLIVFSPRIECQEVTPPSQLVRTEFDSAHNKTILYLDSVRLSPQMRMSALITFEGRQTSAPVQQFVIVTLRSTLPEVLPDSARVLRASWGSEPSTPVARLYPATSPPRGYTEILFVAIPLDTWLRLSASDNALLQVGPEQYPVTPRVRTVMREFNSRFGTAN